MRYTRIGNTALICLVLGLASCATTSGGDWQPLASADTVLADAQEGIRDCVEFDNPDICESAYKNVTSARLVVLAQSCKLNGNAGSDVCKAHGVLDKQLNGDERPFPKPDKASDSEPVNIPGKADPVSGNDSDSSDDKPDRAMDKMPDLVPAMIPDEPGGGDGLDSEASGPDSHLMIQPIPGAKSSAVTYRHPIRVYTVRAWGRV